MSIMYVLFYWKIFSLDINSFLLTEEKKQSKSLMKPIASLTSHAFLLSTCPHIIFSLFSPDTLLEYILLLVNIEKHDFSIRT